MDINELSEQLPQLLPRIVQWVEEMQTLIVKQGKPLDALQREAAASVGVTQLDKVHILELVDFPLPKDPVLKQAANMLGLLDEHTAGITLGHGILIKQGLISRRLVSHECRHVYQYEQAGSISSFLEGYLASIFQVGYFDSPYELDARKHELS